MSKIEKINHFCISTASKTLCGLIKESENHNVNVVDDERNTTCRNCLDIILKDTWEVINRLADKADEREPIQYHKERLG